MLTIAEVEAHRKTIIGALTDPGSTSAMNWLVAIEALTETARNAAIKPHTHVAKYDGGKLLGECGQCGRDIRNEVHAADSGEGR